MKDPLLDVLKESGDISEVNLIDSDVKKDKDGSDLYMTKGSFFVDDTVFTFTGMYSEKINISQIQLNFRFTLDSKTTREKLLPLANELNSKIPCIKTTFKNIEKKDIFFIFSYELAFNSPTDISNIIRNSIEFLKVGPGAASDLLNKKGFKHKSISRD